LPDPIGGPIEHYRRCADHIDAQLAYWLPKIEELTHSSESVDYPDFAALVAGKVASGEAQRGILICGTGIGMQIAANKFPRVRAAVCHDELYAEMSRRHNDTNVLCLPGNLVGERRVDQLVSTWMATEFEGGRHARRIQ
jgi:ribose 5-phosphate isomerase B